jgi:hypothetical protein
MSGAFWIRLAALIALPVQAASACEYSALPRAGVDYDEAQRKAFESADVIAGGIMLDANDYDSPSRFLAIIVYKGKTPALAILDVPAAHDCAPETRALTRGTIALRNDQAGGFSGLVSQRQLDSWRRLGLLRSERLAWAPLLGLFALALLGWFIWAKLRKGRPA